MSDTLVSGHSQHRQTLRRDLDGRHPPRQARLRNQARGTRRHAGPPWRPESSPVCVGRATRVVEYLMSRLQGVRRRSAAGRIHRHLRRAMGRDHSASEMRRPSTGSGWRSRADRVRGRDNAGSPHVQRAQARRQAAVRAGAAGCRRSSARARPSGRPRQLGLAGWDPPVATVEISCGRGFYVRSLAHDLGEALWAAEDI